MTRRRRHAGGSAAAGNPKEAESEDKSERIAVFEKTKMCKFHILGVCMKGDTCRFAHVKDQLQALPDLQRTKLCKTLINTGQCDNPQCKYAHNKEELRPVPDADADALEDPKLQMHQSMQKQQQPQMLQGLRMQPGALPAPNAAAQVGFMPAVGGPSTIGQTAAAAQEAAALFRPGGPLAQYGQPLQDMPMSQKQAAIQQMGQVAQAHAAEAARLHAMAMFLHAHANGQTPPGGMPDQAALSQFLSQGQPQEKSLEQRRSQWSSGQNDAKGGDGQGCSTKSQSDYARVYQGQSANSAEDSCLSSAMSRVLPNEPVHINPRTLSSNSLASMGRDHGLKDDGEDFPGDADDARTPSHTDAKHVLTYAASSQQEGAEAGRDLNQALSQAFTSVKDVMTVKNTFLDFGPHTPVSGVLRSVQTASGRLDLMSQE